MWLSRQISLKRNYLTIKKSESDMTLERFWYILLNDKSQFLCLPSEENLDTKSCFNKINLRYLLHCPKARSTQQKTIPMHLHLLPISLHDIRFPNMLVFPAYFIFIRLLLVCYTLVRSSCSDYVPTLRKLKTVLFLSCITDVDKHFADDWVKSRLFFNSIVFVFHYRCGQTFCRWLS